MAVPEDGLLTGLLQSLVGVGAHRLEQPEAAVHPVVLDHEERLPGETPKDVEPARRVAHRLRGSEREGAGEDRQTAEHGTLVVPEQVVAPADRRMERLLARRSPAAAREEPEAVVEPVDDLTGREVRDLRGGQLDGQRDAVEPTADLRDVSRHDRGSWRTRGARASLARRTAAPPPTPAPERCPVRAVAPGAPARPAPRAAHGSSPGSSPSGSARAAGRRARRRRRPRARSCRRRAAPRARRGSRSARPTGHRSRSRWPGGRTRPPKRTPRARPRRPRPARGRRRTPRPGTARAGRTRLRSRASSCRNPPRRSASRDGRARGAPPPSPDRRAGRRSVVRAPGRLVRTPSERNGGKSSGRSGWSSWYTRSARARSRRRCSPRSRRDTPSAAEPSTSSLVALQQMVCPPCATARRRAARFGAMPK